MNDSQMTRSSKWMHQKYPMGRTRHYTRITKTAFRRCTRVFLSSLAFLITFSNSNAVAGGLPTSRTQQTSASPGNNKDIWDRYSFSRGGFEIYESETGRDRLTFGGQMFARYAYWNWFEGPSNDNEYSYGFQRTRLHFKYTSPYLDVFVQPQYVHMFGLPDNAFKAPPEGPLGMGGLYYKHNRDTAPYDFGVHQASLTLHSTEDCGWSAQLGRFEYSDGLEVRDKSDGKQFNALKNMRLGDRLLSPFGWSAFGRSFDGALLQYDQENANLTTSFFFPTQGGWEEDIDTTIDDIEITTVTLTAKRGFFIPGMELAGFYYNYRDERGVTQRIDNTGLRASSVDIDIHMFGGHSVGIYEAGPGNIDILLWGGGQFGDWYELDHNAYAFSLEAGYQFTEIPAKPWIRTGYSVNSGDDNPSDSDHGTFFQMAPGTRKYNLLPYCDLMNTEDVFVQLITHPLKALMVRADYHILHLNEDNDRWYMGSGPTQRHGRIFGYIGRPSSGEDDLAEELDLLLQYDFNPHTSLIGSYCHIWGNDVVKSVYGEDNEADYLSLAMMWRF